MGAILSSSIDGVQRTLRERVTVSGVGVHSGQAVSAAICPADPDTGISFIRTDLADFAVAEIPAHISAVGATELCTMLAAPSGASVATVEHLLAAFSGLGVDNAVVEIDGPEVPVMDGSADLFVDAIDQTGLMVQAAPRRFLRVLKPLRVELGQSYAEFRPFEGRRFEVMIEYDCAVIGSQKIVVDLTASAFRSEVSRARTFGHLHNVERLWSAGFALGSSLENSVVIADGAVINPGGLRWQDEFARHKVLDAIGDLALAGAPILGLYRSYRGGHKLNAAALRALLEDETAWDIVTRPARERRVPQGDLHGEATPALAAAAFAADQS
ncbi:MAG TPA: UDP-3-O-acyl-N-acetylglucosamine deacetylase [Afifellaceae bacterium]|nr:UDP-3-O-acyl-N-acetylglucosamine deacetylase [Afifellaceae bacterium]